MAASRIVPVAECHSPAEATMIRMVLAAHGIAATIPGEGSASLATAATGFATCVLVHADDAEQAAALISGLRDGTTAADQDADAPDRANPDDGTSDEVERIIDRRKRVGAAVVLAFMPTFGAAHMWTGAWMRGLALAGLEMLGLRHLAAGHRIGVFLMATAIVVDLAGAVVRVVRASRPALPVARLRRSGGR